MEENKKVQTQTDSKEAPLFTGDFIHDNTVTPFEAVAEASKLIINKIEQRGKKNNDEQ